MKLFVASVLRGSFATRLCIVVITTTALLAVMVSAQTTKRRSSKRSVNKGRGEQATQPRSEGLKICQGVPVPAGYVIIAYMTTSACPHGAYVLKKQDAYSESLAEAYIKPKQSPATAAPVTATDQTSVPASSMSDTAGSSGSTSSGSTSPGSTQPSSGPTASDLPVVDPFATRAANSDTDSQPVRSSPQLAASSTEISDSSGPGLRPRRVGASQPRHDSAVVVDDEPERPARPP